MFSRWSRAVTYLYRVGPQKDVVIRRDFCSLSGRGYSKVAATAEAPVGVDSGEKGHANAPEISGISLGSAIPEYTLVNLNKMFWAKPCSLALAADSPLRVEEPKYEGIRHIIFKLLLFYSKQSKSIRGANVVYRRIVSQVDKPAIYNVFSLEKTFKMTFSLLVLHMWLCLRRLKQEGNEGVEFGQYLYELYNHDVEKRVSKAGVNLLLTRWMKDLEKIFYGNIVAYDAALLPEAKQEELENVLWRNVFSDDGSSIPDDSGLRAVQANFSPLFYFLKLEGKYKSVKLIAHLFLVGVTKISHVAALASTGVVLYGYVEVCSQGIYLPLANRKRSFIFWELYVHVIGEFVEPYAKGDSIEQSETRLWQHVDTIRVILWWFMGCISRQDFGLHMRVMNMKASFYSFLFKRRDLFVHHGYICMFAEESDLLGT
ncbi:hypothetical protein RHMOL_Rhmol03G0186600 [Rhododendron molle]|uniref:Uncharacterized protein n=1 Tax=Rhododendron molle TaxID=49168 RepID=A0ACC0PJ20_RHOML|nr:hypothetical protein RHMOL_Rhmol03G0186600 [Rhododendron molle]